MCEMQKLRASVEQILTAAAEEIFGVFKRSITEIEEKLSDFPKHNERKKQRPPDTVHQTVGHADILISLEQQGSTPHVDQKDPEPPHIKEDQQEEWISQEGEQTMKLVLLSECPTLIQELWMVKEELPLEQQDKSPSLDHVDPREQLQGLKEADVTKFPSTAPCVKSEYDEDKAQSSQFRPTEETKGEPERQGDYGGSEPNRFLIRDVACKTQDQFTKDDTTCTVLSVSDTQMTIHTTKKPFCCTFCNKLFAYKSYLKDHMPVHTGEKPFSCSVCKKGFGHKGNLNKHMLIHTGERPFCCSVCNKVFASKSNLKEHMSVHTREKPFNCSVCKKGFANKSNLNKHMPLHTGEKPFSCLICKKSFAHKWNLNNHVLTHTGPKASVHSPDQMKHDDLYKTVKFPQQ